MGTYYQELDRRFIDYELWQLPGLAGRWFRGPPVDLSRPYVACIGSAHTFGRFCPSPFPALLRANGCHTLNLGLGGVGNRHYLQPEYRDVLNGAQLVIIQVLSGRSERNSLYDNSPNHGCSGTRLADGKRLRFEQFLEDLLRTESEDVVRRVVRETRDQYVTSCRELLASIQAPKILLWFAKRKPVYVERYDAVHRILGAFPQLVNDDMLNEVRGLCDAYVECVSSRGLPQRLGAAEAPFDGVRIEHGRAVNDYYPSPEMHAAAARRLAPVCRRLLDGAPPRSRATLWQWLGQARRRIRRK